MNITKSELVSILANLNFSGQHTDSSACILLSSKFGCDVNLVNDNPYNIPPHGFMADLQNENCCNPVLKSTRQQILEEAIQCVTKDRNQSHGEPEDNFQNIADFWNNWLRMRGIMGIASHCVQKYDVAVMMDLMKTSRLVQSPENRDHWVDKAGYSACGAQCAADPCKEMELPR